MMGSSTHVLHAFPLGLGITVVRSENTGPYSYDKSCNRTERLMFFRYNYAVLRHGRYFSLCFHQKQSPACTHIVDSPAPGSGCSGSRSCCLTVAPRVVLGTGRTPILHGYCALL